MDLRAEVHRDGKVYEQNYKKGKLQGDVAEIGTTDRKGTFITFKPGPEIFSMREYSYDILANRMRELSYLNSGLTLTLTDERATDGKRGATLWKPREKPDHSTAGEG